MKRAREIVGGENIPSCIVVLKNQHGYFGWGSHRQRSHETKDGTIFCELNLSPDILQVSCTAATEANFSGEVSEVECASNKGIRLPSIETMISDKPGDTAHDDGGKLETESKMERKKDKRKKHRPKVAEVDMTKMKCKMEILTSPQTPNPKTPGKKKGKVIGRRTFARKKLVASFLQDGDEWEETVDRSNPVFPDEEIDPLSRNQINGDELAAEMDEDHWGNELIAENLQAGCASSSIDINIKIDELLRELVKLPAKSSSPPLLKIELLQLNLQSPVDTLSYIVDNIRIPCLLHFVKQSRRNMAINRFEGGGIQHSSNKVLENFTYVLRKFLPSILMKKDLSEAAGPKFNNRQGERRNRSINDSKVAKIAARKTAMSSSHFQIAPYSHLHESSSRFHQIEASFATPVTSNFLNNGQTPNQGSNNAMELALQSVVNNFGLVDINRDFEDLQNAIVPFVGGGPIVSYGQLFEQIKQKCQRAEVLLDPETNRVWKLLQENEGDAKVKSMETCKLKWWDNERRVFLGRAKSFTARMNLILGDRRFSPWKGSIVDSVVGVFLTQNVSDHLSSSAFMSLAAKFPLQGRRDDGESYARKSGEEHEGASNDAMACLNGHLPRDITSQFHHLQTSSGFTRMESENAIDVDGGIKKVFNGKELHEDLSDASKIAEKEAATNSYIELNSHFRLENIVSSAETTDHEGKIYWESLRRKIDHGGKKETNDKNLDSVNWEAVRSANVNEISEAIRERGMNNLLAERIKDFLNGLVSDHGSIDLEWLRSICPDDAKKYLLRIRGLGLKSVECVRLLALQNAAFPVDTNVARISVRLGWVPLKPLPEFLQLHLLEQYPIIDSVQKYIWPRLCMLDQKELYELHYHMITFGKVFCTKSRPNCSICPMRGECKHFNSAKLALPPSAEKQIETSSFLDAPIHGCSSFNPVPQLQYDDGHVDGALHDNVDPVIKYMPSPIIEEPPPSPPPEALQILETDLEDAFYEDEEIPTIKIKLEQFEQNLQNLMQENDLGISNNDISKALVELSAEAASIPVHKLKNISGLRTEHHVYELPDSHLLLKEMDRREPDDPSPYLLAIWTPGETAVSTQPPESCCETKETGRLCGGETCFACNNIRELEGKTVRGTLLIPCRTAMRGRFPLNGTYFQINEVFADHDSSRNPIHVPRSWLWNLPRRIVYFGTSIATIFRGFTSTEPIQYCFSKGFVCVRGFDRKTREPKPLYARLHLPRSKAPSNKKPWARQDD